MVHLGNPWFHLSRLWHSKHLGEEGDCEHFHGPDVLLGGWHGPDLRKVEWLSRGESVDVAQLTRRLRELRRCDLAWQHFKLDDRGAHLFSLFV